MQNVSRGIILLLVAVKCFLLLAGAKRKREDRKGSGKGTEESAEGGAAACERVIAKPNNEARGHTGYLTFARRIVRETEEIEAVEAQALHNDGKAEERLEC